jgi:hypothetical protein
MWEKENFIEWFQNYIMCRKYVEYYKLSKDIST